MYQDGGYVFPDQYGRVLDPYFLTEAWCKLVSKLGKGHVRLHDLRHWHATMLLEANVHPKQVQERLGHANIAITLDTYSHSLTSMQEQAVEAAKTCPNIYLETCTSYGQHGAIEFLVEGAGEDRVLFGSDMPLMDARMQVGRIVTADISDEAKKKVLGLNAIKLLDLN